MIHLVSELILMRGVKMSGMATSTSGSGSATTTSGSGSAATTTGGSGGAAATTKKSGSGAERIAVAGLTILAGLAAAVLL